MFRLNRLLRPRVLAVRATSDRGAVAVLTAVLLSAALIGFAVIAVDVGAAYDEHRQVRNGADAVALTVARSCARTTCDATTSATSANGQVANGNAIDGSTTVTRVCGTAPGLAACPTRTSAGSPLATCSTTAPTTRYVEVWTRTRTDRGGTGIDPAFAPRPTTVTACARAAYGTPRALVSGLPITISRCWLANYRTAHGGFAPSPPYSPNASAFASWESTVVLHQNSNNCAVSSAGKNAPGNFGYLDDGGAGPCQAYTEVNSTVGGDTGNGNPANRGCSDAYLRNLLNTVVYLPVFDPDATTGTGTNVEYTIVGYAAFYFTGWKLSSTENRSTVSGQVPCSNPNTCISGFFTRGLVPAPGPIDFTADSSQYGASVAALVP